MRPPAALLIACLFSCSTPTAVVSSTGPAEPTCRPTTYWDIAVDPEVRSFRRAMNDAGYATLAVDRLGSGASSTPPSLLLTALTRADAVHHVVTAIRPSFDRVVLRDRAVDPALLTTGFRGLLATDCRTPTSYRRAEAPFYGPRAFVLPGYGHSLNYAPDLFSAVAAWTDRAVGR